MSDPEIKPSYHQLVYPAWFDSLFDTVASVASDPQNPHPEFWEGILGIGRVLATGDESEANELKSQLQVAIYYAPYYPGGADNQLPGMLQEGIKSGLYPVELCNRIAQELGFPSAKEFVENKLPPGL